MLFKQLQPFQTGRAVPLVPPIVLLFPQLVGVHGGIAHENDLVAGIEILQKPFRRRLAVLPEAGAVVNVAVNAVMEIVGVQLFKVVGLGGRLKQLAAQAGIVVHRTAGVHQQQDLHRVLPGVPVPDLQPPRALAGIVDRGVHIQLLFGAPLLRGQLTQRAEGHLELAGVQLIVFSEVPEFSFSRHHHGGAVHGLPADPDAVGMPTTVAPRGAALGPNPVVAAVVLLRLLFQTFLQHFQQFLQRFVRKPGGAQVGNGPFQILAGVVQPVQQVLRQLPGVGHVLEKFQKDLVKAVKFRFILHHDGPAQVIKAGERRMVQSLFHALQQRHPLVQGDVQSPLTQQVKKRGEHGYFTFRRV